MVLVRFHARHFRRHDTPDAQIAQGEKMNSQSEQLRRAIENLIDAKLFDALSKPGGLDRMIAYRSSGVASYSIRMAGRKLEEALADMLVENEGQESIGEQKMVSSSR